MPEHFFHRFSVEAAGHRHWIALHQEQMEAALSAERRVVEGSPLRTSDGLAFLWWYFNDTAPGILRVEMGPDADRATTVWEGRIYDAYVGRLCSALLI